MAKRQRGGARPGQRAPHQRGSRPASAPAPRPAAAPKPAGGLSEDELARAAELEAAIVAEERAASAGSGPRDRRRGTSGPPSARSRSAASLATVADEEYRYVAADLRKILAVFALVFGLLGLSWILIVVLGLVEV